MGSAGVVLAGLWGLTDHTAAYYNENLLQANLLALPLLWLIPRSVLGSRPVRPALVLAVVVAALSFVGLVLKLFPQFYQVNGSVIALALPTHAGIAAGLWRLRAARRS
jgi:peptidoglycan/LPS O-acetylase OafA/YrhL